MFDELGKVEKLYRQQPQSPLFARLADLYLRRGKVERALALCQEGCRRFPHYPTGYLILGKCYEAQGQLEEARSATDQALRLDPENPAGFMRLSQIYQDLGIATLALKSLQQAARFDPLSDKLAEQVDRLTYAVRMESTTQPAAPEALDVLPPAPVLVARQAEAVPPPAAEEVVDEPFGVIHIPQTEAPAAAAEKPGEDLASQAELSATYAGPLEEESLEDLLKRSEEAMAARELKTAAPPSIPAAPPAEAPDLPMEDRLEALFRRGDLFAEQPATAAEPTPEPEPEPEPEPPRQAAPALDEDLFALGASLMAGDSLLAVEPEPESSVESEPVAQPEPEPEALIVQEEGIFSPPDPLAIAVEPADEALEEGLFSALASGADPQPSLALPPGESAEDLRLDDLIGPPAPPAPAPVVLPPAAAQPPAPAAEETQAPAPQAEAPRPRRQDDGELIRLFQEIENQQHQELASQRPPGPLPAEGGDPEGRIATVTLAQIYSSQGFADRAVETYKKILAQDPDNEEIKRRIAELQQGRKTS